MVFHPAWGYFAHAYGLTQMPVEIEGKEPKPEQLAELIRHARQQDIRVVFVQPQFSTKSAELIAREINGRVAVADPLAEAWTDNLRTLAESFKSALRYKVLTGTECSPPTLFEAQRTQRLLVPTERAGNNNCNPDG
jgi:zinc transport system substrate-binding protein